MDGYSDTREPIDALAERLVDMSGTRAAPADDPDFILRLAVACLSQGRLHAAQELFDRVVDCDPISEAAFLGLALSHHRLGNVQVAHRYAGQAATLHGLLGGGDQAAVYTRLLERLAPKPPTARAPKAPDAVLRQYWYTRLTNHYPSGSGLAKGPEAFDRYFLAGLIPNAPLISREQDIATIGSCFAIHIAEYLHRIGRQRSRPATAVQGFGTLIIDDDFFNSFVVREAFEIAFGERAPGRNWQPEDAESTASLTRAVLYDRHHVERALKHADAYVVTLGLAEIWYDKLDGTVLPSGLNIEEFDLGRHGFRVSSVEENLANIARVRELIRKHRGDAPIIFTLSPVPLGATFRPMNCMAANAVSKSILRVAIDRLCAAHGDDARLFYFPSYEIVTGYFADPFQDDMRHVKHEVVDFVMKAFERAFLLP